MAAGRAGPQTAGRKGRRGQHAEACGEAGSGNRSKDGAATLHLAMLTHRSRSRGCPHVPSSCPSSVESLPPTHPSPSSRRRSGAACAHRPGDYHRLLGRLIIIRMACFNKVSRQLQPAAQLIHPEIITIPSTAKTGSTRMRIIMHYNSTRTATCGTFADGEVEDYTVNITGGTFASFASAKTLPSSAGILVAPNPTKGSNINVQLQLAQSSPVTLRITDLSGRILHVENRLNATTGKNQYSIDGLNLTSGTYIILAEQNNGIVARTQFVVAE